MINYIINLVKKLIQESFFLVTAVTLILVLLYIRLLPRAARDLWENLTHYQLVSTLVSVILVLIHIYFCLKLLNWIPTKNNSFFAPWIAKIHALKEKFFWLFINFYKFLWFLMEKISEHVFKYDGLQYNLLRVSAKQLLKKKDFKAISIFLVSLALVPKIIFTIAFMYDVIYCNRLDYTFRCIPWLLIIFLEPIILFAFFDFYDTYWYDIRAFVNKKQSKNSRRPTYSFIPEFAITPPSFVKDFQDFFFNHFKVLINTNTFLDSYKDWKYNKSFYVYISLLLSLLRLSGFVYILVYGLF